MRPDDQLLAACATGDAQAWEELVERYHRLVRSICYANGLNHHDVDDVTAIVFSAVVNQLPRFREGTSLPAWLGVVTRRHVWRTWETRRRESADPGAFEDRPHSRDDIEEFVDAHTMRGALAALSPRCRALLEALYLAPDTSYAQVSATVGIPIGSIGPTRSRCLEALRILLEAQTADQGVPG